MNKGVIILSPFYPCPRAHYKLTYNCVLTCCLLKKTRVGNEKKSGCFGVHGARVDAQNCCLDLNHATLIKHERKRKMKNHAIIITTVLCVLAVSAGAADKPVIGDPKMTVPKIDKRATRTAPNATASDNKLYPSSLTIVTPSNGCTIVGSWLGTPQFEVKIVWTTPLEGGTLKVLLEGADVTDKFSIDKDALTAKAVLTQPAWKPQYTLQASGKFISSSSSSTKSFAERKASSTFSIKASPN